jgi:hypothetical protein
MFSKIGLHIIGLNFFNVLNQWVARFGGLNLFTWIFISFPTPTHKTKIANANKWETTNNKALGPIIMIAQLKIRSSSRVIFITFFYDTCWAWQVLDFVVPFIALVNYAKMFSQNHSLNPN